MSDDPRLPAVGLARDDPSVTRVPLAGQHRLALSDPSDLWVVETGRVEVYYAERHRAFGVGTRRFVAEVLPGELVMGFGGHGGTLEVAVFAIGFDASVLRVPRSHGAKWLRHPENAEVGERLLAAWVAALNARLAGDSAPPHHRVLPSDRVVGLTVGEVFRPDHHLCWVQPESGACLASGRIPLRIDGDERWPISPSGWIEAQRSGASVRTFSTAQLLRTHDVIALTADFSRRTLEAVVAEDRVRASAERERLRAKEEEEARLSARTYDLLGSVLTTSPESAARSAPWAASPLVTATRLVGHELGLEIDEPLERGADRHVHMRDPVDALARSSKIRCRKVVLRGEWWKRDHGPLLAFREEDGRPIALLRRGRSSYTAYDPVEHGTRPVTAPVAHALRPTAYMFFPSFQNASLTPGKLWTLGLRGVARELRSVVLLGAVTGLIALATPIISQILFDDIVPQADRGQLPVIAVLLFAFAVAAAGFALVRGLVLLRVEAKTELNMEAALMDRLLRLPPAFFRKYLTGDLAQRVLGIATIRTALTGTTLTGILSGVFSIISLGLLVYYSVTLALLGVGLAAIVVAVIVVSSLIAMRYNRELTEWAGRISGLVLQVMTSIPKLRVAAAEERAFAVWGEQFARQWHAAYRAGAVQNYFQTFQAAYPVVTSMLFFATMYVVTERAASVQPPITPGVFVAVISAFGQFLGGMLGLGATLISVLHVVPYYERLLPILEAEPESAAGRVDPGRLKGDIEVDHVTFRYAADGPIILNDVSLRVRRGEMIALVGPSGSGKSTLVRLLLGFEQPESGTIYCDGRDLAGLDLDAVRQQFGVVPQHGQLADGDILSNIVGPWNLTLEEAWAAARAVGLEDDIRAMPMGMHTLVSEDGGTFSGGQRQRLLIARALVHNPAVVLLDEATSALDNRSQHIVSDSLERMNVTRVVVAHRLSTVQRADRIYVLDAGRVVESGGYESLLARGGVFAELAGRQLL